MMLKSLPNLLTISRAVGVAPLAYLVWIGAFWPALILLCVLALTDWADGWSARKLGSVSSFGVWADPMADKAMVLGVMGIFVILHPLPWWILVPMGIITAREILITVLRAQKVSSGISMPASWTAKVKTTIQFLVLILLLLDMQVMNTQWHLVVRPTLALCAWLAALLSLQSAWGYLKPKTWG